MEKVHSMQVTLTETLTDAQGRLKASSVLWLAQEAAGEHCKLLGADDASFDGLFWAVLRYRVEITRLPRIGETVTVKTWPMPTTRVAYPRATAAYDEKGDLLYRISSIWVLMDENTRGLVLPGKSGVTVEGVTLGEELPVPVNLTGLQTDRIAFRTVSEEDIDKNHHMNNTRYLAWADDLLDDAFHSAHTLKNFTVCYLSEATLGQELTLNWSVNEEGVLSVLGERVSAEKPDRVFSVKMEFERIM